MGQGTCEEVVEKMEDDSGDEDDWMGLSLLWESWREIGGFSIDWEWRWVKDAAKQVFKLLNFKLSELIWEFGLIFLGYGY